MVGLWIIVPISLMFVIILATYKFLENSKDIKTRNADAYFRLNQRYQKGEISKDEYNKRKKYFE